MSGCRAPSGSDQSGRDLGGALDRVLSPYESNKINHAVSLYQWSAHYLPHVIYDLSPFRYPVPHVLIIAYHGMRYAQAVRWHPAEALFHAAADVREFGEVVQIG